MTAEPIRRLVRSCLVVGLVFGVVTRAQGQVVAETSQPNWTFTATSFQVPLIRAESRWQSESASSLESGALSGEGSYRRLNRRVTLLHAPCKVEGSFLGKSLLDRESNSGGFNFARSDFGSAGLGFDHPRPVGLEMTYRFGAPRGGGVTPHLARPTARPALTACFQRLPARKDGT